MLPLESAAGRTDPHPHDFSYFHGTRFPLYRLLIPGLLGMNLMNSAMWGIGFALVEMRQRKLLKRFVATPMRRSDFLLALTSSRLILMLIEVSLMLGFGALVFHMRILGSLLTIVLVGAIGAVSFGGLGLLTASRAQKIESVSGLMNLVMMPMWIFSGVFFSYQRFPAVVQPFIKLLPLTALNDRPARHHPARCVLWLRNPDVSSSSWFGEASLFFSPCAGSAGPKNG